MLHEAAIKPWQYEHWIFPQDPRFAEKAGPILDLYAGVWEGQPLGPKDYVLSMDEKTSIQARGRSHEETPPAAETDSADRSGIRAERSVAVPGGLGRASRHRPGTMRERRRGSSRLVCWWIRCWSRIPTTTQTRLFFIVDNGSSHRGQASVERLRRRDKTDRLGAYADPCELAEPGGDLLLDHPEEGADAERFREAGSDPRAPGVVRGIEQPHAETVRVEVHSTRHAGLAKTCVAAFSSSFCCVGEGTGQPRRYL